MFGFTKYKKKAKDIKQLVGGYGGCYASTVYEDLADWILNCWVKNSI